MRNGSSYTEIRTLPRSETSAAILRLHTVPTLIIILRGIRTSGDRGTAVRPVVCGTGRVPARPLIALWGETPRRPVRGCFRELPAAR
jgi:hypothetical protein